MTSTDDGKIAWRSLSVAVFYPNLLYGIGQGAIIPTIPVLATALGGSLAVAALATAMMTLGQLAGTPLGGWLIGRIGERATMLAGAAIGATGGIVGCLAPNVIALSVGVLLSGVASSFIILARSTYLTVSVPLAVRGRVMSLLSGSVRLGLLVGPFVTFAVLLVGGGERMVFLVPVITSAGLALLVLGFVTPPDPSDGGATATSAPPPGMWATMRKERGVLLRIGLAAGMITTMRASRQILVPLVGIAVGLDTEQVALLVGICAAVDFALFYLGGQVADRFGRLWGSVPAMVLLTIAHALMGAAPHLPAGELCYVVAAVTMAVGNGISSGIVTTMGSDLADQTNPAPFLSCWRLVTALGPAAAPFAIAAGIGAASIATASLAMAGSSAVGVWLLLAFGPRYFPGRRS